MGIIATYVAGVCFNGPEVQLHSAQNTLVAVVHFLIGGIETGLVEMEGIAIFHDELASTHDPKPWTSFVAKFSLNLIKIYRQLSLGLDLSAKNVGYDLFVGRAKAEVSLMAILHA